MGLWFGVIVAVVLLPVLYFLSILIQTKPLIIYSYYCSAFFPWTWKPIYIKSVLDSCRIFVVVQNCELSYDFIPNTQLIVRVMFVAGRVWACEWRRVWRDLTRPCRVLTSHAAECSRLVPSVAEWRRPGGGTRWRWRSVTSVVVPSSQPPL